MHAILWPDDYLPGTTENFVSNEVIVDGLSAVEVWPWLIEAQRWPDYYENSADIVFHDGEGTALFAGRRFAFSTFGFPVEAQVTEYVEPALGMPGRVAWHGWAGDGEEHLDVHHAWLVEDLSGGRVRILTQEVQKGKPAAVLAKTRPNPMLNGHQDWLDGLVGAARRSLPV
ncbi:SRPBCC domain-containing protein [Cupriavidus consociatus]|uniref:SRPBCC domain-containing protein n=1 Tax=Cupriavidus consociatus TaxID=2821357 RepID=UPI001AEAB2E9|nr:MULTISPECIES: SRPBCC domain-containing protein [unclassified Cupriavidus]MBP0623225.1 SRPBCC domain-containing protein [Cupriavidus sp. LEh25]MDK2659919.1 SRPBCC domain-containing protein [Cupriavidus sp. LEh21]